jgi:hypothetical protein
MNEENKIMVNGKTMTPEEFKKYEDDLKADKSKLIKETAPGCFTVLTRMHG